jgi:CheY-like chemotaxis protein
VLKLPLACVGPAENGPSAAGEAAEVEPRGLPRVLVAEDHPVNRKVIELLLNAEDYELTFAHDGAAAVRAFEARVYDVILMDMQMPVMDGVTATRRIRQLEAGSGRPRTPILMVTANCMPEHTTACAQAGADGLVSKPLNPAELLGAIDAALTRDAAPGPLRSTAAA